MENPILVLARSWWLFCSRSVTIVKLVQQSDQSNGVVHSQPYNHEQPNSRKPIESDEVHKSVNDAHKYVEHADAEGGDEEAHVLLGQAVEDASEAGDVDDTPDDCPDPIPEIRWAAKKGTQDIDDPDDDQADACIPETNQNESLSRVKIRHLTPLGTSQQQQNCWRRGILLRRVVIGTMTGTTIALGKTNPLE